MAGDYSNLSKVAGAAVQGHLKATGDTNPDAVAKVIKSNTDDNMDDDDADACANDVCDNVKKKGMDNVDDDDHAKIIGKHLKKKAEASMSKPVIKMSKLTKEQRDALPVADFGDPDRKLFPILDQSDVDAASHLVGKAKNPDKVRSRIIEICKTKKFKIPDAWVATNSATVTTATLPDTFSVEFALGTGKREDGDHVIIPAPVAFRCGDYPDKQFSLSPEEAEFSVVPTFPITGVELDLEHKPSVLSGKLGTLHTLFPSPQDPWVLSAECRIPKWLDNVLGPEDRKISVAFNRFTKQVVGCGLVRNPRVTDAAMMCAFAKDEEEKNKVTTATTVQLTGNAEIDKLRAEFAAREESLKKQAELEANKAQAEFSGRVASEAVQFADHEIVVAKRALPRERDNLIQAYTTAAKDDARDPTPITFGAERITRVDALKRQVMNREPHNLTTEQAALATGTQALFNLQTTPGAQTNGPMAEDRKKQLLQHGSVGQQMLRKQQMAAATNGKK